MKIDEVKAKADDAELKYELSTAPDLRYFTDSIGAEGGCGRS